MKKDLFLFRHGETDWNREGRMQGGTDIPLNDTGREQAKCLRDFFTKHPVEIVYTSDLVRAKTTAEIAFDGLATPLVIEPRLREVNLGDAESVLWEDAIHHFGPETTEGWRSLDPVHFDFRFPNGESKREHLDRLMSALNDIVAASPHTRIGISTHGASMRRILHHFMPELTEPIHVANCVVYHATFESSKWSANREPAFKLDSLKIWG